MISALEKGQDVDLSKLPPPPDQAAGRSFLFINCITLKIFLYSQLCLIRNCVIRTFANSNKIFMSLENLLTNASIIRISVIRTVCNSKIFTISQRVRKSWMCIFICLIVLQEHCFDLFSLMKFLKIQDNFFDSITRCRSVVF